MYCIWEGRKPLDVMPVHNTMCNVLFLIQEPLKPQVGYMLLSGTWGSPLDFRTIIVSLPSLSLCVSVNNGMESLITVFPKRKLLGVGAGVCQKMLFTCITGVIFPKLLSLSTDILTANGGYAPPTLLE